MTFDTLIYFGINGITLLYMIYNLRLFFQFPLKKYFLTLVFICIIPLVIFILVLITEPQFLMFYSLLFLVVNFILRKKLT